MSSFGKLLAAVAIAFASPLCHAAAVQTESADVEVCLASDSECRLSRGRPAAQREHLLLQLPGHVGRAPAPESLAQGPMRWRRSGRTSGNGQWCRGEQPGFGWNLKGCSADRGPALRVKVMTYNLFWWNLFGRQFRNGNGGSAGKLIASGADGLDYDFMGFQECEDVARVLRDGGLEGTYATIPGDHAVAMAYRRGAWEVLGHGMDDVAEDRREQWYGKRGVMWARFRHKETGKTVLFLNHHGPLPVGTGGTCGRHATAWNILRTIAAHADESDGLVLVGDFNADGRCQTIREIERRMHRVYTGRVFGGVDHVFSSCGGSRVVSRRNLGGGGSDHDALDVVIEL